MMRQPPGGFLGCRSTLRALSGVSPIQSAIREAHRFARRHLEAGGATAPAEKRVGQDADAQSFVLPPGTDPLQIALAIAIRLHGTKAPTAGLGDDALMALARKPNGAVVVLPQYVRCLGGGDASRGRRVLQQILAGIRGRRGSDPRQLGSPPSAIGTAVPSAHL